MTGLLGFSSGYRAMMNCDLLLMIGTDFPYQQFFKQCLDLGGHVKEGEKSTPVIYYKILKKTVQKFIGDAISQALKSGASPSGALAVAPLADHLIIEP